MGRFGAAGLPGPGRNLLSMGEGPTGPQRLAVDGGPPVRAEPFPARGAVTVAQRDAAARLFEDALARGAPIGYGGPEEDSYCQEFASYLGGGYADAVCSGTAAVFVALCALQLTPGSEVVVGAIGDPGMMMPVVLAGCVPVVADVAAGSYNAGPESVAACLTDRTSAILLGHIAGEPADAAGVADLARQAGVALVEDCAQAVGARLAGRPVGTFGDVAAFSTMNTKHLSTGGQGGLVFTRGEATYRRVRQHADRGKPFGEAGAAGNLVAALNLNTDELHAAIGRAQLADLPERVAARRQAVQRITQQVAAATGGAVRPARQLPGAEPSYWFLRLWLDPARASCSLAQFRTAVRAEGVPVLDDPPMPHTMPWFSERFGRPECPEARRAISQHFAVPVTERWTGRDTDDVLAALAKVAAGCCR